ncbi:MAG: AAA family ATPase [Anaerolineae bacterium]
MARVLVIDDNAEMLEMLKMILHHQGDHEVLLSAEAEQGLEMALTRRPDVAIIDVMMPQMNGYEVVRHLRADLTTAEMGIIILTARGQPVDRIAAMEAGADYYMSKPVDAKELLSEIENLVSARERKHKSVVFPIFSLRGGIGTTTVAVNLALLLQQVGPTALLDLSPNSGHCALYLGLKPVRHWGTLLQATDLDNATTIGGLTLKHASGLRLLAAPPVPLTDEAFNAQQVELLLDVFRKYMRFIVVDTSSRLNQSSPKLFDEARRIVLVSGSDSPGIQTTLQTLKVLDAYREKILLVVNNPTPGRQPPLEALQRALHRPIAAHITYDTQQDRARNSGVPSVLSQPKSQLVIQLQKLVRQLLS